MKYDKLEKGGIRFSPYYSHFLPTYLISFLEMVDSMLFDNVMDGVLILNAVLIGCQTYPQLSGEVRLRDEMVDG